MRKEGGRAVRLEEEGSAVNGGGVNEPATIGFLQIVTGAQTAQSKPALWQKRCGNRDLISCQAQQVRQLGCSLGCHVT